jgi:branched-chain amino acid transport system substrate-binding protein
MKSKLLVVLFAVFLLAGFTSTGGAAQVKVGALNDVTGATSDVGKDYALGISDAIHYVNDQGGVNGKKIKLYQFDYGYRIPEALTKYKLFKRLKVVAVLGWGTGDTEALSPTITKDKMPYVSASYSAHLTNPEKTPYNLFAATDYSTNARAAITAWFDKRWPKHPDFGKRKPRFVSSYQFAHPYCSAPIKAIKDQATILGFDIGPDQNVGLTAIDTKSQVLAMKEFKADLVWHGNTTMSVAATVRDAFALGLGADHIVNKICRDWPARLQKASWVLRSVNFLATTSKTWTSSWNTPKNTIPVCRWKNASCVQSRPGQTFWPSGKR